MTIVLMYRADLAGSSILTERFIMNPLKSIAGTIVSGFVLAIILALLL